MDYILAFTPKNCHHSVDDDKEDPSAPFFPLSLWLWHILRGRKTHTKLHELLQKIVLSLPKGNDAVYRKIPSLFLLLRRAHTSHRNFTNMSSTWEQSKTGFNVWKTELDKLCPGKEGGGGECFKSVVQGVEEIHPSFRSVCFFFRGEICRSFVFYFSGKRQPFRETVIDTLRGQNCQKCW